MKTEFAPVAKAFEARHGRCEAPNGLAALTVHGAHTALQTRIWTDAKPARTRGGAIEFVCAAAVLLLNVYYVDCEFLVYQDKFGCMDGRFVVYIPCAPRLDAL